MINYYSMFRPDLWSIKTNFENTSAIISPEDNQLEVHGTFHTKADKTQLIWSSEDPITFVKD